MTMSIVHRATGMALYGGMLLLVLWLVAAAVGGAFFEGVDWLFGTWLGQLVLFGFTFVLFHHMLGGIRHFVWDLSKAMDPAGRELAVRLQLGASVLLTLAAWSILVWFK